MAGAASGSRSARLLDAARLLAGRIVPPVTAAACFGYAGYEAWHGLSGQPSSDGALLREQMAREADQLDQKRVEWVRRGITERSVLYRAETLQEVHNIQALGPAGVLLKKGEAVEVLEEGAGMEQGFNVVRRSSGATGIFPKQYLRRMADVKME
eukprot:TRINITY_DN18401_c0_g1_i1.p2 TRINITY_DN18401_c0_g1~~TRINITY_DN18401_c0_g1_i1.p2  ORF type:complete len:154 (-),score=34.49 TRINITY_DN18401_c0_g1_i1:304-765(-)